VKTHFHDVHDDLKRPATADAKRRGTSMPAYTINQADRLSRNKCVAWAADAAPVLSRQV